MCAQLRSDILSEGRLNGALENSRSEILQLLCDSVRVTSLSGHEGTFIQFVRNWAKEQGFETDLWETTDTQLASYSEASQNHISLKDRPTLVVRLPGCKQGRSLVFNAHADVVGVGEEKNWSVNPWGGQYRSGRIYGRGACDAKGPLVGALWAMLLVRQTLQGQLAGDILLELVPGEEDCVGIGTLTSIVRGYKADAAIVLEPTDNLPRCASRSGVRFEIVCYGKASHGTAKWLGKDAIAMIRHILDTLEALENRWSKGVAEPLFAEYPVVRPITVDYIHGGQWQGMVCDKCLCAGYLELLPDDDINKWKSCFTEAVQAGRNDIVVSFKEEYSGHRTPTDAPFCVIAEDVIKKIAEGEKAAQLNWKGWTGFNSGCEAGVRANLHGTPTLVWGPGNLAQAHAADEFINFQDIEVFAKLMTHLAAAWSGTAKET